MRPRILTTTIKEKCPRWGERTELLPGWREDVSRTWLKRRRSSWYEDLNWGWKLFRASRSYDVVVTGYERPATVFALLQYLGRRNKVPHVCGASGSIGAYVERRPRGFRARIKQWIKRRVFRAVLGASARVIVYSRGQIEEYARAFALPASKFACLPYYFTLWDTIFDVSQGDYVFAGGDYTRDYATLLRAAGTLPYRVVIAAFYRHYFEGIRIPPNVEILTTTHEGFIQLMAGAGVVVLPFEGGLLHTGGEQTYLNAMLLGKAVIVADDVGATEYIESGVNGVVLRPGDAESLRSSIQTLMDDRDRATAMGEKAKAAAAKFTPDRFFNRLLALAEECVNGQSTV